MMASALQLKSGDRIGAHLTVLGRINGRSSDPVYMVWNAQVWCPMACKLFGSPRRARREAKALSSLSHPNIVRCLGYEEPAYVLMEFLEGPTLDKLIARQPHGRMNVSDALRVAIHLGAAIQHIHSNGFLHMDVKPGNVIVVHGRPVLFDFGSMRVKAEPRPQKIDGTDPYIAPEEAMMQVTDEASDVFALGVTLYEMLTGMLPFPNRKQSGLLSQVRSAPVPLRRYRPRAGAALEDIVMSCLARAPSDRPTMNILLPALNALIRIGPSMWPPTLRFQGSAKTDRILPALWSKQVHPAGEARRD